MERYYLVGKVYTGIGVVLRGGKSPVGGTLSMGEIFPTKRVIYRRWDVVSRRDINSFHLDPW